MGAGVGKSGKKRIYGYLSRPAGFWKKVASRTNRGILTGMLISSRNSCMQSILTAFFCAAIRLAADWRAIRGKVPAPRQNACVVRCRGNPQGAAEFSSAHCKISRAWKNLLLSIPVVGPLLLKPLQKFIYKIAGTNDYYRATPLMRATLKNITNEDLGKYAPHV